MTQFQYGKAITDSFKLIFSNLYVFVPMLLVSVISLLFLPFYFKLIGFGGKADIGFLIANFIWIALFGIAIIILSYLAYGWTFALIGQIVRKGKADLWKEFKNDPRKGLTFFLASLIAIVIFVVLMIVLLILIFIGAFISQFSSILGITLMVLFIIAWVIALVVMILYLLYIAPLISLEGVGPINTIKASFKHFKNNKNHSLALLGILVLFSIISTITMYIILFSIIGSFSNEALALYIVESPFKYSVAAFFSGLPSLIITLWSFAFLAIAYTRKKSKK